MINAVQALEKLQYGNQRYLDCFRDGAKQINDQQRNALAKGQAPFAIILGCSDSRVPAELIFDQGLGDLFVIRVAGNIAAASQIASIEYAVASFGTPLIIVMGHSQCGAVNATIDHLQSGDEAPSPSLASLISKIAPAVSPLLESDEKTCQHQLQEKAVTANVQQSISHLSLNSDILKSAIEQGDLTVIGAEYSLETGKVNFYQD